MKTRSIILIFLVPVVALIVLGFKFISTTPNNSVLIQNSPEVETPVIQVDLIRNKVETMSLEEKIGQLLIIGFEHPYIDGHIIAMIKDYHIGGINLLGRNIIGKAQTIKLMADLQALSSTTLLLATDQEGGRATRFNFLKELTAEPKIKTEEQAYTIAFTRGQELKELGVNTNFAPVLDYVSDPAAYLYARTFATTSDKIGELGNAMIVGYKHVGIISVAKHFPGYGNIKPDPHKNAAIVDIDSQEFEKFLAPFKSVIDNGVDAIMTAHIIIPSIDTKPATISSKFLTGILRNQLGFKGVIITDDLEMASAGTSIEEIAVESIKAGADMVISTYTPEKHISIFNSIKKAVNDGRISEKRIDESVYRILIIKEKLQE